MKTLRFARLAWQTYFICAMLRLVILKLVVLILITPLVHAQNPASELSDLSDFFRFFDVDDKSACMVLRTYENRPVRVAESCAVVIERLCRPGSLERVGQMTSCTPINSRSTAGQVCGDRSWPGLPIPHRGPEGGCIGRRPGDRCLTGFIISPMVPQFRGGVCVPENELPRASCVCTPSSNATHGPEFFAR